MKSRAAGFVVFATTLLAGSSIAQAHIALVEPMNRYEDLAYQNAYVKSSPCGNADNPAGTLEPVVYQAGETITVTIDEYVSHSGFIRVAVAGSDQDFVAPTGVDAIDDAYTIYSEPDMNAGGEFDIQVTLPNAPCDPCVMQVIQVMTTSGGDFNGNYFQCADIVIEGAAATGGEETTGGGGSTGGGTTSDSGSASTTSTTSGGSSVSDSGTSTAGSAGSTEGGTATDSGTSGEPLPGESTDDGGCSCRQSPDTTPGWAMLGLLGLLGLRRRR